MIFDFKVLGFGQEGFKRRRGAILLIADFVHDQRGEPKRSQEKWPPAGLVTTVKCVPK